MATLVSLAFGFAVAIATYVVTQSFLLTWVACITGVCLVSIVFDVVVSRGRECGAAMAAVRSRHPEWSIWTLAGSVRAVEPERYVVAVFYESEEKVKPPRYVLVALDRHFQFIEFLPVSPESPYYILGHK